MVKLKVYFGIEEPNRAGAGIEVVEKKQQELIFSDDAVAKAKSLKALEERIAAILKGRKPSELDDDEQKKFLPLFSERIDATNEVGDIMKAAGLVFAKNSLPAIISYLERKE